MNLWVETNLTKPDLASKTHFPMKLRRTQEKSLLAKASLVSLVYVVTYD